MGKTARARMLRFQRSTPNGEPPTSGGGGAPAPQAVPAGQPATPPTPDQPLGEAGLKALQAERDARKAAEQRAEDLAKQIAALNDKRPADEKVAEQLAELTRQLESEKVDRLRSQTALKHTISAEYLPLLTATTADELEAQGALVASLQKAATATAPPATPGHQPHPGQGAPSSGEPPAKTLKDGQTAYEKYMAAKRPQPASST